MGGWEWATDIWDGLTDWFSGGYTKNVRNGRHDPPPGGSGPINPNAKIPDNSKQLKPQAAPDKPLVKDNIDDTDKKSIEKKLRNEANQQINADSLKEAYKQNALTASQQQLAQSNALMASQKGINPALMSMQIGSRQAAAGQLLAGQEATQLANIDFQTSETNISNAEKLYGAEKGVQISQNQINAQQQQAQSEQNTQIMAALIGAGAMYMASTTSSKEVKTTPEAYDHNSDYHEATRIHMSDSDEDPREHLAQYFIGKQGFRQPDSPLDKLGSMKGSDVEAPKGEKDMPPPRMLKKDDKKMLDFLDTLEPTEFAYKPGSVADDGGKPHLGVIAENVEKTPAGKSAVVDVNGVKSLDIASLSSMLAAGLGNINQRVKHLERSKNG